MRHGEGARDTLGVYNAKRDFKVSPEPQGKVHEQSDKLTYVVQRHDASHLHFDFRLELDGVLKSWAIPKGPSLSPKEKRLAVEVEDHPYTYGSFEGAIPKGEYGGGHVLIWDHGEWEPHGDPHVSLRKGHLSFTLKGDKLHGDFALVRLHGKNSGAKNWLLMKRDDSSADTKHDVASPASPPPLKQIELELCLLGKKIPLHGDYIYEMKLDGYRAVTRLENGKAKIESRNGIDWTAKFPRIREAIEALKIPNAIFDGEICAVDAEGRTRFQELQRALSEQNDEALQYFIFDLPFVDGEDIRDRPLLVRKAILESILHDVSSPLTFVTHLDSEKKVTELFGEACRRGLEGIIAKRRARPYVGGRGGDWIKVKCTQQQEMVIVGFSEPKGKRGDFGALLLGVNEGKTLRYAGRVGTGFDQKTLASLGKKLRGLSVDKPQVVGAPRSRDVTWVEPKLVCQVSFTEWTRDGSLRHPSFLGLREDKAARDVVREVAKVQPTKTKKEKPTKKSTTRHEPNVTHGERVVDKKSGTTKLDLANYYQSVAPLLLPYAHHRPIALVRCPEGADKECFFQKRKWVGAPSSVHDGTAEKQQVLYIDDEDGLLALIQFGTLEIHGWGSKFPNPKAPTWMVMDLDPDEKLPFKKVIDAALEMRELFASVKLQSFVKTTGGKGLHVVVPIEPHYEFDVVKDLTHAIASDLVRRHPDRFVDNMAKSQRTGKIFVDYLRNGAGATAVLPYSARTKPGLPVAMPIAWNDLKSVNPLEFTVQTTPAILKKRKKDPWADFFALEQALPKTLVQKK
jgi:bifunctional non-homologous end joining protein LigD